MPLPGLLQFDFGQRVGRKVSSSSASRDGNNIQFKLLNNSGNTNNPSSNIMDEDKQVGLMN